MDIVKLFQSTDLFLRERKINEIVLCSVAFYVNVNNYANIGNNNKYIFTV